MRMTGETKLNMFFAAMLPYADKLAIRNLLANFGYDTRGKDITAAFCMKAYKEYGAEFGKPFASILRKAVESPRFQAERKLFMSSGLSRSNSTTNNKINLTTDQKVSLIDKGIDAALAIISGGMELGKSKYGNQAANSRVCRTAASNFADCSAEPGKRASTAPVDGRATSVSGAESTNGCTESGEQATDTTVDGSASRNQTCSSRDAAGTASVISDSVHYALSSHPVQNPQFVPNAGRDPNVEILRRLI